MDISNEAVEAAAWALDPQTMGSAGALADKFKDHTRADAQRILEAAAPFIAAQVWDEGHEEGWLNHESGLTEAEGRKRNTWRKTESGAS